ncbi:hypothetical protein JB92DRAFT_3002580 [Gautieria morchelliformis]|nr:hypothetical protein JB92DRAFT_3002580 [Gautieria morchelliformis]
MTLFCKFSLDATCIYRLLNISSTCSSSDGSMIQVRICGCSADPIIRGACEWPISLVNFLFQNALSMFSNTKGLAVDQLDELLFAARDDSMIRAWWLHTGQRLQPPLNTDWSGLLTTRFASTV